MTDLRVDACFDDVTTRTLKAHAPSDMGAFGWNCLCGWFAPSVLIVDATVDDADREYRAHVAVELRTALVAARIPEPCPKCEGKSCAAVDQPRFACSACGGVGTIHGEDLLVAMTMDKQVGWMNEAGSIYAPPEPYAGEVEKQHLRRVYVKREDT